MLPLEGLRVVDLSRLVAGPFCTTILGDLGADIIKVEGLPDGDLSRESPPFDHGEGVYFLSINRNKRSVAIDLRAPGGLDVVRELTDHADVFIENFKPGTAEQMGLAYDVLAARNPRLIYASVSGFGQTGPYGPLPGVDQIAQGMSGLMSVTGQPQSGPTRVGVAIGDLTAAMWLAIGVQSALIQRTTTGKGQRIETSLLASLVGLMSVQAQRYLSLGDVAEVAGNHHPTSSPYGMFHARDGAFNFSANTRAMWQRLCEHLGMTWMIDDPRFANSEARSTNRAELEAALDARFRTRDKAQWIEELRALGMPAGPVYNMAEMFDDPQVKAARMVETIEHPRIGPLRQLASPLGIDAFKNGSVRFAPPRLGEHTIEVLNDFGFSKERIADLLERKIVAYLPKEQTAAKGKASPGGQA